MPRDFAQDPMHLTALFVQQRDATGIPASFLLPLTTARLLVAEGRARVLSSSEIALCEPEAPEPEAPASNVAALSAYQAKKEARITRYQRRAEKARQASDAAYQASNRAVAHIPLGQPILIGHHSEKRHRADLARSHRAMDRSVAEQKKAEYWAGRVAAAQHDHAISADDPEAGAKLAGRIADLEETQRYMKTVNRAYKRGTLGSELGWSEAEVAAVERRLAEAYSWEKQPYPGWQLSNNNANIRRLKTRLDTWRARQQHAARDTTIGDVRLVENHEDNRTQLFFPEKPDADTRALLKRSGFRWAPSQGCWQRQLSDVAWRLATEILTALAAREP